MQKFFLAILWVLPLGLLARVGIGGAGILPTDILLPLFALVYLGHTFLFKRSSLPKVLGLPAFWVFVFLALVSFWLGAFWLDVKPRLVAFAYVLRLFSFGVFAWAGADLFGGKNFSKLKTHLFSITAVIVVLGFVQFFVVPDISKYSTEGGLDPHIGRMLSTWLDPNYLAGFLGFMLPIVLADFYAQKSKKIKFLWLVLGLSILLALFLTFSRSGYLAAVAGLFLFFVFKDPKIILLGIFAVLLGLSVNERAQKRVGELAGTVAAVMFQQTDEIDPTASLRIQNWGKSFDLFKKYPLTGIGYNTYRYRAAEEGIVDENYFSAGGADSTHLTVLVTMGLFGLLSYLYWVYLLVFQGVKDFFIKKSKKQILSLGFSAGVLSLFIHASFVNSLFFPLIFVAVCAFWGALRRQK
ncbi:hypothetical protein CSB37_00200 [bacterium DOLZORAL124_38_8]|nr:MAG: hypothetical protein CSB37_00200 [bacterium DOLZORAL124_38_8]